MKLVCGLGNPGKQYANTWHNAGFLVVDAIAKAYNISYASKFNALIAGFKYNNQKVYLVKTLSYMNTTGGPLKQVMQYYNVDPSDLIVVHDDIDLELGVLKSKFGGGEAGHNGLKSISGALNTQDYQRIRLGVGRGMGQVGEKNAANHVLSQIGKAQQLQFEQLIDKSVELVLETIDKNYDN
jgi:PTH1 family peptidyl-tRNA hydrolase